MGSRDRAPNVARTCPTCGTNPVRAGGECATCYEFRRRNGRARPARLARRQADLNRRRFEDRLGR